MYSDEKKCMAKCCADYEGCGGDGETVPCDQISLPNDIRKHVVISWTDASCQAYDSRFACFLDSGHITVTQLCGKAIPVSLLPYLLDEFLGDGWMVAAEKLHRTRKLPWKYHVYAGQSGCMDFRLKVLKNAELGDIPTVAFLHVSMYGKLNEGEWKIAVMDIPPILAIAAKAAIEKYDMASFSSAKSWPIPRDLGEFLSPGSSSGLLEQLCPAEGGLS